MPLPQTNITAFTGMNAPTRADPDNFDGRAEDAWNRLKNAQPQMNTLATQVNDMATAANASATNAATSAANAATSKTGADTAKTAAETAKTAAETAKAAAETARTQAQAAAAALRGTSVNALTIGVGSKSLTTETGRQFDAGQTLKLVVVGNGEAWMSGRVTSYNSATGALVVNVLAVASAYAGQGSNTWNLYVAGEVGPTGPMGGLSGGNLTGALNERRASQVPTSASPDIWSAAGNWMYLTGDGTVTGFPTAPQSGSRRTLLVNGKITFQSGANMIVYGGTMTLSNGDLVDVTAEDLNLFLVTVRKKDGTPVQFNQGAFHNLRVYGSSGVFTALKTGWHKITVVGGSGCAGAVATLSGMTAGATGAGAGGFISGMRWLTAGVTYVITVGAGGPGPTLSPSAVPVGQNGNDGSGSSFSGSGIVTMTANGGTKGLHTGEVGQALPGGVGGSASGAAGDLVVKGGDGGYMQPLVAGALASTGGGSVGIRGQGFNGGDAAATASNAVAVAGGAGVGGKGGNAIAGAANATCQASGGGCASAGANLTNAIGNASQAGANFQGAPGGQASYGMPNDLDSATGGGGPAITNGSAASAPNGGATGGEVQNGGTNHSGQAGMFAGAGGYVAVTGVAGGAQGQNGGAFGGAPGGVASRMSAGSSTTNTVIVPSGSSGGVWIEW